ncbi:MAG TPA: hypothetical protein VK607_19215 [Kofleriaceae bacterium]|nr:hypothetical protein [Kofleriaceae bacterium]
MLEQDAVCAARERDLCSASASPPVSMHRPPGGQRDPDRRGEIDISRVFAVAPNRDDAPLALAG